MAEPTTSKLCTVCGIDCSGKPRIKDQQGRYICKECFDKAKQTRQTQKNPVPAALAATAATSGPAEADNSFLLDLGSAKESTGLQGTKPCPECGRAMPTNAVICIGCGFNTSTGKRVSVRVIKSKQKKEKAAGAGAAAQAGSSMVFALIGGVVGGGIGAAIWAAIAYFAGVEVGWIAWAVGGLAGAGSSIGARGHAGTTTGGLAAAAAVLAILAGKFVAGSLTNTGPIDVWFPKLFGVFDILWFFLAIGTAYKVGSVDVGPSS